MISVIFKTFRDHPKGYAWKFPTAVATRPIIGDFVQAADGTVLKVCAITHCVGDGNTLFDEGAPYIMVELTHLNS